jgi:hypothetical protein
MSFPSAPDVSQLVKSFEEASAHLKLLANKPDVHQGNLIVQALNDICSRLGNIEKNIKDLQDEVALVRGRVDAYHQDLIRKGVEVDGVLRVQPP